MCFFIESLVRKKNLLEEKVEINFFSKFLLDVTSAVIHRDAYPHV